MKKNVQFLFLTTILLLSSCSAYNEVVSFPPADELFITSGDGDIQKPYTPVGELIYYNSGYRIPLPLLGYIPIDDLDPDEELRNGIFPEIRRQGGDGLINMKIRFEGPKGGFLGMGATGGHIYVTGTIIKR